jgi:CheY-like chemotaxis protein
MTIKANGKTILCVDDEPLVLTTLAAVLRQHGFTVVTASNSAEALEVAKTCKIDVALLDRSICDREQLCLYDVLRQQQPEIKAAIHTGNPETARCTKGVLPVLLKPVEPREIAEKIEDVFRGSAGDGRIDE